MIMLNKEIKVIPLYEFKLGHNAVHATCNINNALMNELVGEGGEGGVGRDGGGDGEGDGGGGGGGDEVKPFLSYASSTGP
ncbi:hypothetical protein HZH68_007219 [Vespula germanica]|uniref:Uncharacterized protein n=1 Tax=Vespula germanica TaxID=30212 RepID=A0A834KAM6_VESGE|nr:hypothetical protein HZH68_007219 [Vespula germanica]